MKKYRARIGLQDRHTGTKSETVHFEAANSAEAKNTAENLAGQLAYRECPDHIFVESVTEIK